MRNGLDEQRLWAWRLFLQAYARVVGQLEDELEGERCLPLTWYDVLAQLSTAPEHGLRLQELSRYLVLSKSGLTRRIDRMEEAGLVMRHECPVDGRGVFAVLTPAGRAALEEAKPVHLAGIAKHFAQHLSDEEAAAFQSAFKKMLAGFEESRC